MGSIDSTARVAVIFIAIVVLLFVLDITQTISAPIVLALIAGVIVSPLADRFDKIGLSRALAALFSFLLGIIVIVGMGLLFQPAIVRAIDAAPEIYAEVDGAFYTLQRQVRGLKEVEQEMRGLVGSEEEQAPAEEAPAAGAVDAIPTVEDVVYLAPAIAAQILIFLGVFFFFVLSRREIYDWIATRMAPPDMRFDLARRLEGAERQVSRYFLTISVINMGLGAAVGVAMALIGMPSPIMWGMGAFVLNYLLYIGPASLIVALAIGGVFNFDGVYAALPALAYVGLNTIESQFVTPMLVGKSLSVNPLIVFVALTFFLWLWGPIGAVVAIPLLVWINVLSGIVRA